MNITPLRNKALKLAKDKLKFSKKNKTEKNREYNNDVIEIMELCKY